MSDFSLPVIGSHSDRRLNDDNLSAIAWAQNAINTVKVNSSHAAAWRVVFQPWGYLMNDSNVEATESSVIRGTGTPKTRLLLTL